MKEILLKYIEKFGQKFHNLSAYSGGVKRHMENILEVFSK